MAGPNRLVLFDTNLLLVVLVGVTDVESISKHKRTLAYTAADFEFLVENFGGDALVTTPHVLTEVSNLGVSGFFGAKKDRFLQVLKELALTKLDERSVPSAVAATSPIYDRLGLTDAAIERVAADGLRVVTADAPLWVSLVALGVDAINYNHVRPGLADLR